MSSPSLSPVRAQGPEPKAKGSFDVLIEKDFDHAIYVALQFHIYCGKLSLVETRIGVVLAKINLQRLFDFIHCVLLGLLGYIVCYASIRNRSFLFRPVENSRFKNTFRSLWRVVPKRTKRMLKKNGFRLPSRSYILA